MEHTGCVHISRSLPSTNESAAAAPPPQAIADDTRRRGYSIRPQTHTPCIRLLAFASPTRRERPWRVRVNFNAARTQGDQPNCSSSLGRHDASLFAERTTNGRRRTPSGRSSVACLPQFPGPRGARVGRSEHVISPIDRRRTRWRHGHRSNPLQCSRIGRACPNPVWTRSTIVSCSPHFLPLTGGGGGHHGPVHGHPADRGGDLWDSVQGLHEGQQRCVDWNALCALEH